jgi:hypothetical protein
MSEVRLLHTERAAIQTSGGRPISVAATPTAAHQRAKLPIGRGNDLVGIAQEPRLTPLDRHQHRSPQQSRYTEGQVTGDDPVIRQHAAMPLSHPVSGKRQQYRATAGEAHIGEIDQPGREAGQCEIIDAIGHGLPEAADDHIADKEAGPEQVK